MNPGRSERWRAPAEPAQPLPIGPKGQGMAIAAFALQALTGHVHRVHWCVDLKNHIGTDADHPLDPSNPHKVETKWGQYLQRFRNGLNMQRWGPFQCGVALTVRHTLQSSGETVITHWTIPWSAHLPSLCRAEPPVGVWRLHPCPPHRIDPYDNRPMLGYEGDALPDTWWYDGIPF